MASRVGCLWLVGLLVLSTSGTVVLGGAADGHEATPEQRQVVIAEVLVSASSEQYNGTDWNGDGTIGSVSDQYIELWNTGDTTVDVSDWWLDDATDGGSPPCRLAWNTTLDADERLVVFRGSSGIELDYWDGDAVTLSTDTGALVDQLVYPGEDSWWDRPYERLANGTLWKADAPTPGWGPNDDRTTAQNAVRCYRSNDHIHSGAYVLTGRIVPMTGPGDVIDEGHVLVQDGTIAAVWENDIPANVQLTNVPVIATNGTIYPGLIDLHNHLHYNQVPLWNMDPHLPVSERNAWGGYNNRYEWKNHPDYSEQVTKPKMLVHSGPYWNMESEAMKYIEMKSIVGGTTAAQGSPSNPDDSYASILARNIEDYNFGRDEIHTKVTELTVDYEGNHIKNGNNSGTLDAWFVHIAEGVDERSRAEFDILVNNDLLVGELVLIHGVALTSAEFVQMAAAGSSLVWSPLSNLLLYGQTADVAAAKAAGVHITLAPDWSPSGSKSPLHELKVADLWDDEMLGDIFSDYELVEMVTSGAARATNWHEDVGTLTPGTAADLVVVDNIHADPYRNLINAVDPDVRLSVVGGLPLYGDSDLMAALNGADREPAGRFGKALDVTFSSVPDGAQSWSSIVENLTMALAFDPEEMQAAFGDATDFDSVTQGMTAVGLDPWYTYGDERYFEVLNGSSVANAQIDLSLLYDRYYNRSENLEPVTQFTTPSAPNESCPDGSSPPCQTTVDDPTTGDGGEAANTTQTTDDGSEEGGLTALDPNADVNPETAESEQASAALTLLAGIVVVLGLVLLIVSRQPPGELSEKVTIDAMWDNASTDPSFVPAPPPLKPMTEEE
jgi:5-methylthioadenosine/S-adenosylhomocysteine deaminase